MMIWFAEFMAGRGGKIVNRVLLFLVIFAAIVLIAVTAFFEGTSYGRKWEKDAQASRDLITERAQTVANETDQRKAASAAASVVTVYVDRVKTIYKQGATIEKEIPVYVPIDTACQLPSAWRGLHDAAASGSEEEIDGARFADAPSIDAQTALYGVTANYRICHQNAAQLSSLQAVVRDYQERGGE
jgi:hypothetical protein